VRTRPYRHKLNMLEPGFTLCKAIGILFLLGAVFHVFGGRLIACILWGLAALLLLVLCVLLRVEQHQDRAMLEQAEWEDAARNNEYGSANRTKSKLPF